jgi:hypothetical protein
MDIKRDAEFCDLPVKRPHLRGIEVAALITGTDMDTLKAQFLDSPFEFSEGGCAAKGRHCSQANETPGIVTNQPSAEFMPTAALVEGGEGIGGQHGHIDTGSIHKFKTFTGPRGSLIRTNLHLRPVPITFAVQAGRTVTGSQHIRGGGVVFHIDNHGQ